MISVLIRLAPWICGLALGLFGSFILIVLLGGIRVEFGTISFSLTTIEFPLIAFFIFLFSLLLVTGKWRESIILGMAIFLAGLLGEGLLRVVKHPLAQPYLRSYIEPSSLTGTRLVPGYEGFGPLDVLMKVNSEGFRDDEHGWEKAPNTFRIIGLGDSFTFGWGMPRGKAFLERLKENIEKKTRKPFEVINAGVPGWGLNNYYYYLKYIGQKYDPDVVILAYYVDDLNATISDVGHDVSQPPFPAKPKKPPLNFEGGMLHHSYLFNFLKSLADKVRHRNRMKEVDYLANLQFRREEYIKREQYLFSHNSTPAQEKYTSELEKHLSRIQRITNDMGASLIIMLIPDVVQLHHREVQYINTLLADIANTNDIPFLDLTPHFEKSPDVSTFFLLPRDFHTNELGHKVMADELIPLVCTTLSREIAEC